MSASSPSSPVGSGASLKYYFKIIFKLKLCKIKSTYLMKSTNGGSASNMAIY